MLRAAVLFFFFLFFGFAGMWAWVGWIGLMGCAMSACVGPPQSQDLNQPPTTTTTWMDDRTTDDPNDPIAGLLPVPPRALRHQPLRQLLPHPRSVCFVLGDVDFCLPG